MDTLPLVDLLKSVQHALNAIPRKTLRGDPNGIRDTYELATQVDQQLKFWAGIKEE